MIQNAPIDAAQDEVIFSAKYSIGKVSGMVSSVLIVWCLVFHRWYGMAYDVAYDIYDGIVVGGHGPLHFLLLGSIMLLLLLPLLSLALNPLCFKEIIFYPNRVEIVRRIFRSKTITIPMEWRKGELCCQDTSLKNCERRGGHNQRRLFMILSHFYFLRRRGKESKRSLII